MNLSAWRTVLTCWLIQLRVAVRSWRGLPALPRAAEAAGDRLGAAGALPRSLPAPVVTSTDLHQVVAPASPGLAHCPPPPLPLRPVPCADSCVDPLRAAVDAILAAHGPDMAGLLAALRAFLSTQDFDSQPDAVARVAEAVVRDRGPMREGPTLFAFSGLVEFFVRDADLAPGPRLAFLSAIARCRPEVAWSLMFELCAQLGGDAMREGTRGALHGFLMDPSHPMASATRAHMLDAFVKRAPMAIEDVAP